MNMESRYNTVQMIEIPTYTAEESRLRTKLKLGVTISKYDAHAFIYDIKSKFGSDVRLTDDVIKYLNSKYPNWNSNFTLNEELNQLS